jgi:hypothetical protein
MTVASPFQPRKGGNSKLTATITSQNVTLGKESKSLRIMNAGAQVIYFRTYNSTNGAEVATNADTPVATAGAAGSVLIIEKPYDHDTIAYIADSATAVVHFQAGEGGM